MQPERRRQHLTSVYGLSSRSPDPWAALSDEFNGVALDAKWQHEDTSPGAGGTVTVSGGQAYHQITAGGAGGSFWFNANDGEFRHQTVTVDEWEMRCALNVRNAADSGLPPIQQFRIAGISVQDPNTASRNYVHVGLGATNGAELSAEWKSTEAGVSRFGFASNASGAGELSLVRQGQVFTCRFRPVAGAGLWTALQSVDRDVDGPAMPTVTRCGFILYAQPAGHDISSYLDYLRFSDPTL